VRLEQARLCCLVIVGVRADGTKELVAVCDGERESTQSWAELLRDLRRRGMRAPVLAVGDGALGLWAALRDVFPATRHQRDWVHKAANVLGCLPAVVQAGARKALAEIRDAPDRDHAQRAIQRFAGDYGVKWPKAVAKITDDAEELLAFFDFPAEHWLHLKTSNPIESTFASVRLRTRVTKGPGSKAAGLAMAFKLLEAAQDRWRAVNGPHLVALVRAGARFERGRLVERPAKAAAEAAGGVDPVSRTPRQLAARPSKGGSGWHASTQPSSAVTRSRWCAPAIRPSPRSPRSSVSTARRCASGSSRTASTTAKPRD
jgi:transposase-like protein